MSSLYSENVKNVLAKGDVRQVGSDSPIAIRLRYTGTDTVTSVTVTTATNIVLVTTDSDSETTTTTCAFATYTTIGDVVDYLDNITDWDVKILDTIRSEASASQLVDGVISASTEDGNTYYDAKLDTSACDYFAVRLTYDRGFDKKQKSSHRVELQEVKYLIDFTTVSANNVKIYEIDGVNETIKMQELPVDNTATTLTFASGRGYMTSGDGNDIVVKIDDGGDLVDGSGNYLRIVGLLK